MQLTIFFSLATLSISGVLGTSAQLKDCQKKVEKFGPYSKNPTEIKAIVDAVDFKDKDFIVNCLKPAVIQGKLFSDGNQLYEGLHGIIDKTDTSLLKNLPLFQALVELAKIEREPKGKNNKIVYNKKATKILDEDKEL